MTTHTPGPWAVDDEIFVSGPDGVSIFGGSSPHRDDVECMANARLAAAAPDMLKALEYARDAIYEAVMLSTTYNGHEYSFETAIKKINSAIAKATNA